MRQVIRHIDDVLPHIKDKPEFVVIERDGYKVIDYLFVDKDTFSCPILLECRGIKFGTDGRIIARPFQKFFNVGEKQQTHEVDWSKRHTVMDKLDGSMVHSATVKGHMRFMTRKGITDIANRVEEQFLVKYRPFLTDMAMRGMTPIFEYTAPDNRIVIRYTEPRLILLALRDITSGVYLHSDLTYHEAGIAGVPYVGHTHDGLARTTVQLTMVRQSLDKEGIVIRFDDGHMLKVKADDYVMKHRVIDDLNSKKKVLALIFADGVDDILPILDEIDRAELLEFRDQVNQQKAVAVNAATMRATKGIGLPRNVYAAMTIAETSGQHTTMAFAARDGKDLHALFSKLALANPEIIVPEWRDQ